MSDDRIDIRTELAASKRTRVDIGRDGVLHVLAGPITLHLDRATCEELTTTLARAMVALARSRRPRLRLVTETPDGPTTSEPTPSLRPPLDDRPQAPGGSGKHGSDDA
jgi:hypothetical protein